MDTTLETKLVELGLTAEQIAKLFEEGVVNESDMALLTVDQTKQITGCGLVTAVKIIKAFTPAPQPSSVPISLAPPAHVVSPEVTETITAESELPEGKPPTTAHINAFAATLGMDPNMLFTFMAMSGGANAGMGMMDLSDMIDIHPVVAGYRSKRRNMFYAVMGQIQTRLGTNIVVINEDGSVNRELTVEYIEGLEEGREVAENDIYFDADGVGHEIIAVGVDAQSMYDADPLDSSSALQQNGMGKGRINWNGVSLEVRQAVHCAVKAGEIDPATTADLAWLRDHIKPGCNRHVLQGQAPNGLIKFNQLFATGELPVLRVRLNRKPRRSETMPRRRTTNPRELAGLGKNAEDL